MSRRRFMMLQQSKPDLLEGYRVDNTSTRYKFSIAWIDENTIELKHTGAGFLGPVQVAKNFIGSSAMASTGWSGALENSPAMNTLELGKLYCLTLTVTEVLQNTATVEDDGNITLAFGRGGGGSADYASTTSIKFSELEVGTQLEVIKSYKTHNYATTGACLLVTNPNLLWNIKFKVELKEV